MNDNIPNCPRCAKQMVLKQSDRFRYKNGEPRRFWSCSQYPKCRGTHSAHPDGRPMGIPGDQETKMLRRILHTEMERLKKKWGYSKSGIYIFLQTMTGLSPDECHIAKFDKERCLNIIERLKTA